MGNIYLSSALILRILKRKISFTQNWEEGTGEKKSVMYKNRSVSHWWPWSLSTPLLVKSFLFSSCRTGWWLCISGRIRLLGDKRDDAIRGQVTSKELSLHLVSVHQVRTHAFILWAVLTDHPDDLASCAALPATLLLHPCLVNTSRWSINTHNCYLNVRKHPIICAALKAASISNINVTTFADVIKQWRDVLAVIIQLNHWNKYGLIWWNVWLIIITMLI